MNTIASIYAALMLTACGGLAEDTGGAIAGFAFCTFAAGAIIYQNLKRQA
jgi:hypothetical protein